MVPVIKNTYTVPLLYKRLDECIYVTLFSLRYSVQMNATKPVIEMLLELITCFKRLNKLPAIITHNTTLFLLCTRKVLLCLLHGFFIGYLFFVGVVAHCTGIFIVAH